MYYKILTRSMIFFFLPFTELTAQEIKSDISSHFGVAVGAIGAELFYHHKHYEYGLGAYYISKNYSIESNDISGYGNTDVDFLNVELFIKRYLTQDNSGFYMMASAGYGSEVINLSANDDVDILGFTSNITIAQSGVNRSPSLGLGLGYRVTYNYLFLDLSMEYLVPFFAIMPKAVVGVRF